MLSLLAEDLTLEMQVFSMNGDLELCDAQELHLSYYPLNNIAHLCTLELDQSAFWRWSDKKCP